MSEKPSKKWLERAELYVYFAREHPEMDFSETAALEQYRFETYGDGDLKRGVFDTNNNGYAHGKHLLNIQVASWREDIQRGQLSKFELLTDLDLAPFREWLKALLEGWIVSPTSEVRQVWRTYTR